MFIRCACPCFIVFYTQYRVRSSLKILITDELSYWSALENVLSVNMNQAWTAPGICYTFAFVRNFLSFSQTPSQSTYFIRFCLASPWTDVVQILKSKNFKEIENMWWQETIEYVTVSFGEIKAWPEIECEVSGRAKSFLSLNGVEERTYSCKNDRRLNTWHGY